MSKEYDELTSSHDSYEKGGKDSRSPQEKRGTAAHKWDRDEDVQWANDSQKGSQPSPWRHLDAADDD